MATLASIPTIPGYTPITHERLWNGDVSKFRIMLVNRPLLRYFNANGLYHYKAVGTIRKPILFGDLIVLEMWDEDDLLEVFPDNLEMAETLARRMSLINFADCDFYAWERLMRSLETTHQGIHLSGLDGFKQLPRGIQTFVLDWVDLYVANKVVRGDMFTVAAAQREDPFLISLMHNAYALLESLEDLLSQSGAVTPADFFIGWADPCELTIQAFAKRFRLDLDDDVDEGNARDSEGSDSDEGTIEADEDTEDAWEDINDEEMASEHAE
ncbi:hypothetical protein JCM10908_001361 [Rhodotorula pacifica]|uniref:uncharacterized protein n=1 Tax=Rhodotorula pacifica TaxID=1495444 RepID=UPI00317EA41D